MIVWLWAWLLIDVPCSPGWASSPEKHLDRARKDMAREKWDSAWAHLERLLLEHGDSSLADDAHFWQAVILERRGRLQEALQTFSNFLQAYPHSELYDNAVAHQIHIAQKLFLDGRPQFKRLIEGYARSRDPRLRLEAAVSLAELGDSTYASLLNTADTEEDPWLQRRLQLARETVQQGPVPPRKDDERARQALLHFQIVSGAAPKIERKKSWRDEFLFFKTRRYRLYERLYERYYANDHEWSIEELMDYGLFHIVPPEEFERYLTLADPYDRHEWLHIFWKQNDPTPTTPENEFRDEFMRRVKLARAKYGEEWNYRHFRYLRNQYMRNGWSWSPWDSRGELVVKLGEPDLQEPVDFHVDVWYYSKESVSFGVNRYVTNIYGNGYFPDGVYAFQRAGGPLSVEVDYIYTHRMFYDPFEGIEWLKGVELKLSRSGFDTLQAVIRIPRKRLAIANEGGARPARRWQRRVVVFDSEYREVYRSEKHFEQPADAGETDPWIMEILPLPLPKSRPVVAIRIEDLNSGRLSILKRQVD